MTSQQGIDHSTSVARAKEHAKVANLMFETGHEWAAVCGFYSAYHLIRASFISDPVFDDANRLSKINPKILPEDRWVTKHSMGGLRQQAFGINEIVSTLYLDIRAQYTRLHMASNRVRYDRGLTPAALDIAKSDYEAVTRAFYAGEIVCTQHLPAQ